MKKEVRFILTAATIIIIIYSSLARAETVTVKYRGVVDLAPFQCAQVTSSSFIERVCYDERKQYMLIQLGPTYYHYCGIDNSTVSALLSAESPGTFYNASIKGRFDCRVTPPPKY
jgi:hypothetical protein